MNYILFLAQKWRLDFMQTAVMDLYGMILCKQFVLLERRLTKETTKASMAWSPCHQGRLTWASLVIWTTHCFYLFFSCCIIPFIWWIHWWLFFKHCHNLSSLSLWFFLQPHGTGKQGIDCRNGQGLIPIFTSACFGDTCNCAWIIFFVLLLKQLFL